MDVDEELIASVKAKAPEVAVLCNTGCRPDTIARKLTAGDAAVVGTYFKEGGKLENERLENLRVDVERVRTFMTHRSMAVICKWPFLKNGKKNC